MKVLSMTEDLAHVLARRLKGTERLGAFRMAKAGPGGHRQGKRMGLGKSAVSEICEFSPISILLRTGPGC